MWTYLKCSLILTLALWAENGHGKPIKLSKPEDLIATGSQMTFKEESGEVKTGVDTGDSFRAESRQADGSVKGVYGWVSPEGKPVTVSFSSNAKQGYRTFNNPEKLNVVLPSFPISLSQREVNPVKGEPRIPNFVQRGREKIEDDDEDIVVLEDSFRFGEDENEEEDLFSDDGVLVGSEGDDEDLEDDEELDENSDNAAFVSGFEELLSSLEPGTPVAQSNPSATAISGHSGVAQVNPSSSAIVGPGGVAISLPMGQALVGPGGIAISAPISTSQAGAGGIAIASTHSTAVAGIESGAVPAGDESNQSSLSEGLGGDPGFFKSAKPSVSSPWITNYFLQFLTPDYYGAAAPLGRRIPSRKRGSRRRYSTRRRSSSGSKILSTDTSLYGAPNLKAISEKA